MQASDSLQSVNEITATYLLRLQLLGMHKGPAALAHRQHIGALQAEIVKEKWYDPAVFVIVLQSTGTSVIAAANGASIRHST